MAITVGLDFGTHQTKICIENSDNPHHKTYEFLDWGNGCHALPSVIQINKDHTLSYGKINLDDCLLAQKISKRNNPGELILPLKPIAPDIEAQPDELPPAEPEFIYEDSEGDIKSKPYGELYGIGKKRPDKTLFPEYCEWYSRCAEIEDFYEVYYKAWQHLNYLCGEGAYPEPEEPPYPEEPFLEGYDYDYDPMFEATEDQKTEYTEWRRKYSAYLKRKEIRDSIVNAKLTKYKQQLLEWQNECDELIRKHNVKKNLYEQSIKEYPMVFRYFKQASFSNYLWTYEIPHDKLCILYLAYVIFHLENRFGNEFFSIQMGVPASDYNFDRLKQKASLYLIKAYMLVEDVFSGELDKFLATPYETLLEKIPDVAYSDELKYDYEIIILPEAFAALRSLTAQSKIPQGTMCIMLDVGGGTTDFSFFVVGDNKEPEIYHFKSISKGLNFFLEYSDGQNEFHDFTKKRELEDVEEECFRSAYVAYKTDIEQETKSLINYLHIETIRKGISKRAFPDAIKDRPIIYTGGGCYDGRLRRECNAFTDIRYIDKELLNMRNVRREKEIRVPYSILATAFGLSIHRADDEVVVAKKEDFFARVKSDSDRLNKEHEDHWMRSDF